MRRPRTRRKLIAATKAKLTSRPRQAPDPSLGRAVFAKTCQQCHTLFGVGRKVGPELTGSNRADLDYLLSNVLDPAALDRQGLPGARHRHRRWPRSHRDPPGRGQRRSHDRDGQRDGHRPQGRGRGSPPERQVDDAR